jgi:hypothetical protein
MISFQNILSWQTLYTNYSPSYIAVVLRLVLCGFETVFQIRKRLCWGLPELAFYRRYLGLKKSKEVPLQARSGPEGSRKLRFPNYMTTAQDGGKVVSLTHRPPLPPGSTSGTRFC